MKEKKQLEKGNLEQFQNCELHNLSITGGDTARTYTWKYKTLAGIGDQDSSPDSLDQGFEG
jgi:hypothetical protein